MKPGRFGWGLACLGAAVAMLVVGLAVEHQPWFKVLVESFIFQVVFSLLSLSSVGLLWSDVGRRPLRWAVAIVASLIVGLYHAILLHGPG